jgi:hypothetical protein
MLLVGYLFGIRSERRLCEEVHLNLAYRWFCRVDLADRVPDHSTFSKNRHGRFRACNLHRLLFEQVVARCAAAGLVAGRDVAVDGSTIMADASREKKLKGTDAADELRARDSVSRPVAEYLAALDAALPPSPDERPPSIRPASRRPIRRRRSPASTARHATPTPSTRCSTSRLTASSTWKRRPHALQLRWRRPRRWCHVPAPS